jgi:hypothetical protein
MKKKIILLIGFSASSISAMSNDVVFFNLRRAQRRVKAHTVKSAVAEFDEAKPLVPQAGNGDEQRYADLRGSFGKILRHQDNGFQNRSAFSSLVFALQTGVSANFNNIILGGVRRLVNPQASLAFSLDANDSWINGIPPAPSFASAETAGEMVELYWTVTCRDIPFNEFSTNGIVASAVADLNTLSDFKGPKVGGVVTPETFLRGIWAGDLDGPYISQFFYQTIPFGSTTIGPEQTVPTPGAINDFMTNFTDWFTVINGGSTGDTITFDGTQHFLRTPRDLAEYVHLDTPGQSALAAALYLYSLGAPAMSPALFYLTNKTQEGFVTFGISDLLFLTRAAVEEGLKAAWYHKWQVNLRLRPEEYGFYLQQQIVNGLNLGINDQLVNSGGPALINASYGSYFLPQAYPEGSPAHPAYPAGHATVLGAGVTILKAFFNEDFAIPNPLMPNASNDMLVAYPGTLTIGGELNKLASNIALGRDHAGVHYRSDGTQGMLLGEQVAIDVLNNYSFLFNENFTGFSFTTFQGNRITVGGKRNP